MSLGAWSAPDNGLGIVHKAVGEKALLFNRRLSEAHLETHNFMAVPIIPHYSFSILCPV